MLVLVYILLFAVTKSDCLYTIVKSKSKNATFRYMDGVEGESDIHVCEDHEVCNVVHDRFWISSLTERLCLCRGGKECPWQLETENSTVSLNNKSQLKFCNSLIGINVCTNHNDAAKVYGKGDRNNSYLIPYNVTLNCICPDTHYWRLQKYTYEEDDFVVQVFKCVKKRLCESHEFCGHIRSDLYSTYYKCTCPEKHLCIFKDRTEEVKVQELLYSGAAYKAYCVPNTVL